MSIFDSLTQEQIDNIMSVEKAQANIARWEGAYHRWMNEGDERFAKFWLEMAESEKRRLVAIREYKAYQWCDERGVKIQHTDGNVIVDIPGFDTIIAQTLVEAVQLARELEQQCTPPVQEELPEYIPSAAELDELEESLQAGKEMAEDETAAIKAQMTHGAYYL